MDKPICVLFFYQHHHLLGDHQAVPTSLVDSPAAGDLLYGHDSDSDDGEGQDSEETSHSRVRAESGCWEMGFPT